MQDIRLLSSFSKQVSIETTGSESFQPKSEASALLAQLEFANGGKAKISPALIAEISALSQESDEKLFYHGALRVAQRLRAQHRFPQALALLEVLAEKPSAVSSKAKLELEAITGQGHVGYRSEFLLSQFIQQATDYRTLLPMLAGSLAFSTTRALTLSRLVNSPAGTLTRGLGARLSSNAAGFVAEVPTFALGTRTLLSLSGEKLETSIPQDLATATITLGSLKSMGFLTRQALLRNPALANWNPLSRLQKATHAILPQMGAGAGLMIGHDIETRLGLRPSLDRGTSFTDTLSTLIGLHFGMKSVHGIFPGLRHYEAQLAQLTASDTTAKQSALSTPHQTPAILRYPARNVLALIETLNESFGFEVTLEKSGKITAERRNPGNQKKETLRLESDGPLDPRAFEALRSSASKAQSMETQGTPWVSLERGMALAFPPVPYMIFDRILRLIGLGVRKVTQTVAPSEGPSTLSLPETGGEVSEFTISEWRERGDVDSLLTILDHPELNLRYRAMSALEDLKEDRATEPFIAALSHPTRGMRFSATVGLGNIGDPRALSHLSELRHDPDYTVRQEAARAIGKLDHPSSARHLIPFLEDTDASTVQIAIYHLAKKRDIESVDPLLTLLGHENIRIKIAAIEALGVSKDERAVTPLLQLISRRNNIPTEIKMAAIEALGKIGDIRALQPIFVESHILGFYENSSDRFKISLSLARLGDLPSLEMLIGKLSNPSNIQGAWPVPLIEALGEIKSPIAVQPLIRLLRPESRQLFISAAEALGNIGDRRAIEPLANAINFAIPRVEWVLLKALGQLKPAENSLAFSKILTRLRYDTWSRRVTSWVRQGLIQNSSDIDPLLHLHVRIAAAEALGEIGSRMALDDLVKIYSTHRSTESGTIPTIDARVDPELRKAVIVSLGRLEHPEAIPTLLQALTDTYVEVRLAAVKALRPLQTPEITEALTRSANYDLSWRVRQAAEFALSLSTGNGYR